MRAVAPKHVAILTTSCWQKIDLNSQTKKLLSQLNISNQISKAARMTTIPYNVHKSATDNLKEKMREIKLQHETEKKALQNRILEKDNKYTKFREKACSARDRWVVERDNLKNDNRRLQNEMEELCEELEKKENLIASTAEWTMALEAMLPKTVDIVERTLSKDVDWIVENPTAFAENYPKTMKRLRNKVLKWLRDEKRHLKLD